LYVRRNRRRFWKAAAGEDKQSAYLTLYECLDVVHRLMAPFVPFLSEAIYQNLVRPVRAHAPLSVHMTEWPSAHPERCDRDLLAQTEIVQRVVGLGRAARNTSRLKVRQPLARMLVRVPDEAAAVAVRTHTDQILDELNIKTIELIPRDAKLVSYRIKPNLPLVGKRYGKLIPAIREYLNGADGAAIAVAAERGEAHRAVIASQEVELEPAMLLIETESAQGFACAEDEGYLVGLDTTLNPDLEREGVARELVRVVQDARKEAGREVSDRIVLGVEGDASVQAAVLAHKPYIMAETLSSEWAWPQGAHVFVKRLDDPFRVEIRIAKAEGDAQSNDRAPRDAIP
jgi:isoleucyl-tRNA synthetase